MSSTQRMYFFNKELFNSFAYSYSSKYYLEYNRFTFSDEMIYDGLKSGRLDMILCSDNSNVSYDSLNSLLELINPDDILILNLYTYLTSDNEYPFKKEIKKISSKCKIVLIDQEGESYPTERDFDKEYKDILDVSENIYIISNRAFGDGDRISSRNYILNLSNYFHYLTDNLSLHPQIPYNKNIEKEYDYISYLGLKDSDNGREWRSDILKLIEFEGNSIYTPRSFDGMLDIQYQVKKTYGHPESNMGSYVMFSIIESLNSKVKIAFETEYPEDYDLNKIYFTEKTLKCLIYEQPYFLFLHKKLKKELINYGFKLPKPESINEMIKYISSVNETGLDKWIEENEDMFKHNKNRFYQLMFSPELPYYNQLMEWGIIVTH